MSVAVTAESALSTVQVPLKYRIKGTDKPVAYPSSPDVPDTSGRFEYPTVSIANGRPIASRLSLDSAGA